MFQENLNASIFEAQVACRLDYVERYVRDFLRGKPSSSLLPLWNLRTLQDECRQAGRQDLSTLCQRLEHGIMALQAGQWEDRDRLGAEIAAVREDIQRRAGAVGAVAAVSESVAGMMEVSLA